MLGTKIRRWHWNFLVSLLLLPFPLLLFLCFSFKSMFQGVLFIRFPLSNPTVPGDTTSQEWNFCLLCGTTWNVANVCPFLTYKNCSFLNSSNKHLMLMFPKSVGNSDLSPKLQIVYPTLDLFALECSTSTSVSAYKLSQPNLSLLVP